jgi:hypothetical protein
VITVNRQKSQNSPESFYGGVITSYVLAHRDNPEKHVKELAEYMTQRVKGINEEEIRQEIRRVIDRMNKPGDEAALKATLFTKDGKVRKYRDGLDFCEKCGMFKNYEKECPYCGHHEIKI